MLRIAQEQQQQNNKNDHSKRFQTRTEAKLLCSVILFLICVCIFCVTIFIEQRSERQQKQTLKGTLESIGVEAFDKQMQEDQKISDEGNGFQSMDVEKIKNMMSANSFKSNNQFKTDGQKITSNLNDIGKIVEGQQENKQTQQQIGNQQENKGNSDLEKMNNANEEVRNQQIKQGQANDQLRAETNNQDANDNEINAQQDKTTDKGQVAQQGQQRIGEHDENQPYVQQQQHIISNLDIEGQQSQEDQVSQQIPAELDTKKALDNIEGIGNSQDIGLQEKSNN